MFHHGPGQPGAVKEVNRWDDHYARRARNEKWPARSVYKLEEIDKKYRIIRAGDHVLDLGCYPGSWSRYSLAKVGSRGSVVGIDLKEPRDLSHPNFRFIRGDVLNLDEAWIAEQVGQRDVVISDLAPATTGIRVTDASRSTALSQKALDIALEVLKNGGHFLCKIFENEDAKQLRNEFSHLFEQTRTVRPAAVRKTSREVYILGLHLLEEHGY